MIKRRKKYQWGAQVTNKAIGEDFGGYSTSKPKPIINTNNPTKSNYIPSPTIPNDNYVPKQPTLNYNYTAKNDNIQQPNYQPPLKSNYTPVSNINFAGKPTTNTLSSNLNQGTITKAEPRTLYNTYFNTPKNEHGTGIIPFTSNMINAYGAAELGQAGVQGIKYGAKKLGNVVDNIITKKVPISPVTTDVAKQYISFDPVSKWTFLDKPSVDHMLSQQSKEMLGSSKFNKDWVFDTRKYPHIQKLEKRFVNQHSSIAAQNRYDKLATKMKEDYAKYNSIISPYNPRIAKYNKQYSKKIRSEKNLKDKIYKAYDDALDPIYREKVETIRELTGLDREFEAANNGKLKQLLDNNETLVQKVDNPNWAKDLNEHEKNYIVNNEGNFGGVNMDGKSIIMGSYETPNYKHIMSPNRIGFVNAHEGGHTIQKIGNWDSKLSTYNDDYKYFINRDDNPLANRFRNAMIEPEKAINGKMVGNTHNAVMVELHSDLQGARYSYYKKLINDGHTHKEAMAILKNPNDETIDKLFYYGDLGKNFKPTTTWEEKKELIKLLPAFTGAIGTAGLMNSSNTTQQVRKHGGRLKLKYKIYGTK